MEQGTEFLERAFAAVIFCAACTMLLRELMLYRELLQKLMLTGYGVWYVYQ